MRFNMNGVVQNDRLSGFITAKEFKRNWDPEKFFQWYQRERVNDKSKVNSLKTLFKANKGIDAITLNLVGDFAENDRGVALSGELHVIDGQQRLSALMESECDYDMPVIIHYNLTIEEEISLFETLNRTQTKLSLGEHAKTCKGPFADQFRSVIVATKYPVKVSLRKNSMGISAATWCALLHWTYHRLHGEKLAYYAAGNAVVNFLEKELPEADAQKAALGVRKVLERFVQIFGTYSNLATAYNRSFILVWCHVVIDNFLTKELTLDFRGFDEKILMNKFLTDSYVKELLRGSQATHGLLYNKTISFLNHKKRMDRLANIDGVIENARESDNE